MRPSIARLAVALVALAAPSIGAAQTPEGLGAADWSGICEAYEAGRHAVFAVDGGHEARSFGQAWLTRFDRRGFTVRPDAGGWTWGLELERYGFAGQERAVAGPARVAAEGQRVAYAWDDTLEEWYVNGRQGLEHGYTVRRSPLRDSQDQSEGRSPLTFTLAVRGDLVPEVQAGGRDVRFLDGCGAALLVYSGLTVFDADGHTLPAHFERGIEGLLLRIDERGARYPLTIDPIAQQAYLKASNTDLGDNFGYSVSVSNDTVVVGAPFEDSNSTGVNGNQSNNSAGSSGAAYVFVREGTTWSQQAYLKASNTDASDWFGYSVSVSGDIVVVGARLEDSHDTGVNGNQGNSTSNAGAAYVFVRNGTTWSQQAYLKASNTGASDYFGESVCVSGDTVVIGAPYEDSNASGVNGWQGNVIGSFNAGAAYVFVRNQGVWSQEAYLKASNPDLSDLFGFSVSVSDNTVVVGALREESNATGVNGNQSNNSASWAGAVYVFVRVGTVWSQQAYLKASNTDPSDNFGGTVSVWGDTVVVGAPFEDSNSTGVNGNQSNDSATNSGAVYVFVRDEVGWSQQAYLKASNTDPSDSFGSKVSVWGDTVAVGAAGEDSNATGVNGNQSSNSAATSGAAYVFVRDGTNWSQAAYLKASNTDAEDRFGIVSVSGETVVVGAYTEASNSTGVNSNQSNNNAIKSGAAYVFVLKGPSVVSVTPSQGPFRGGYTVMVIGECFTPSTTVDFGGVPSPLVTYVSATELSVEVPRWPLPPRSIRGPVNHAAVFTRVDVSVTDGPWKSTLPGAYTYELELRQR